MSRFETRLQAAVATYRRLQTAEGGWGEDRLRSAPASIVNTSEVLAVLAAARVRYEEQMIQNAMAYLARAVVHHPKQKGKHPDARGEHARYCAWGLAGLTVFEPARHDRNLVDAHVRCVEWLGANEWKNQGAWGEDRKSEHPSLLSTSAAIRGLGRLCDFHPAAGRADALATRARAKLDALAQQSGSVASWRRTPTDRQPSAAATAMAVLSLTGGSDPDRELARRGGRWLLAHVTQWSTAVERDGSAPDANWHHMSFSLALRAVLETKVANLESRILRDSIAYLDELWSEDDREWRHGQPGARPSPTGSYAVVMAHQALRSVWPLDVTDAIRGRRRDGARGRVPAEVRVDVDADARITVTDLDGTPVSELTLPPGLRALFLALAARHEDGASERTVEARSIATDELTTQLGIERDTVRRYADRINTRLQKDARERGDPPPGELIQHMGISRRMGEAPTGRLGERRWILNVDRVSIHPDARPSRQKARALP